MLYGCIQTAILLNFTEKRTTQSNELLPYTWLLSFEDYNLSVL